MTKIYRYCVVCCFVLSVVPSKAHAEFITFGFTGEVTEVPSEVASAFTVGDSVIGNYTFDSLTLDVASSNTVGYYVNTISSFSATVGGDKNIPYEPVSSIAVITDITAHDYLVLVPGSSSDLVPNTDYELLFFIISIVDSDGTVFDDTSLPLSPPDLSAFEVQHSSLRFQRIGDASDTIDVLFDITSLFYIPEPTALSLIGISLVMLTARRARNYSQQ